jgi:hypothetical protein
VHAHALFVMHEVFVGRSKECLNLRLQVRVECFVDDSADDSEIRPLDSASAVVNKSERLGFLSALQKGGSAFDWNSSKLCEQELM